MKLRAALPLLVLFACSSSSNGTAPPAPDSGPAPVDAGNGTDSQAPPDGAPPPDAADAAEAGVSYEQAVLASSWAVLPNAPMVTMGAKQDDIYLLDAMHGFAVSGPASSIYETQDGGNTWTTVEHHPGTYFRSILFPDATHGFSGNLGPFSGTPITDPVPLYQTSDSGMTWSPVTAITGPMPTGVCNMNKIDAQHLVAVGRVNGPAYLLTSSDGGMSWTSKDMNTQFSMLIDARFTTPMDGILVGGSATVPMQCTILHTSDGGASFQTVFTSATSNSLCWKITFPSSTVGYVSVQDAQGGSGTFAKTLDGGMTWTEMPLVSTAYPGIGMGFITENIGWVSADDPTLPTYRTIDGGMTWQPDANLKSPVNRFRFVDKNTAYAIGGSIYKMTIAYNGP